MNSETSDFINKLMDVFRNRKRPPIISSHKDFPSDDYQCNSIQNQFGSLEMSEMKEYDAKMMILDSVTICDEAILYFLPKLSEVVLLGGAHPDFFLCQLNRLDKLKLSEKEMNLIEELIQRVNKIIKDFEIEENNENQW